MKKRICPVCEHEMKSRNYCRVCRRFVKNPIIQDVNYRLNEGESLINYCDCDYHTPGQNNRSPQSSVRQESVRENQRAYERGVRSGASIPHTDGSRRAAYQRSATPPQGSPVNKGTTPRGRARKKGSPSQVFALVGLFLFLNVAPTLVNLFIRETRDETVTMPEVQETEMDESIYMDESYEDEVYYTDEEVQAKGIPCNGYAHFSIQSEALNEQLIGWTKQNIASLASTREDSDNVEYPDSDLSYYDSYTIYYFPSKSTEHADNYIEIGYDTVNTQVHYVNICLSDEGKWLTLTEKSMELLAAGEDNLSAEDTGVDKFRLDYVTGKIESDGYWESKLFDVYFYRYSDGVPYVSIYRMDG